MEPKLVALKGYVKNFKDGTTEEHIKYKPMTGYRGRTTIQLFNAETGELEQEVMSENVINNWIAKDSFDANFRGQVNKHKTNLFADPFTYLLLSDIAIPESADAKEIVGRIAGWSSRDNYSGSSTRRGTYNSAESWLNNRTTAGKTQAHLVFDFPTHAANGTIRTIYWAPSILNIDDSRCAEPDGGISRCSNVTYQQYPEIYTEPTLEEFQKQQLRAYQWIYNVPSKQGRMNLNTKMFYGVAQYKGSLTFAAVDIDRCNMAESDFVKCSYADGSTYTSYPGIMGVHIDPTAQQFKVLFWTNSSTTYKDMPLQYQYYEVTFNFSGTTQSIKSFNISLLMDNDRYPSGYDSSGSSYYWHYDEDGLPVMTSFYRTPATNPQEYENYSIKLNSAFNAVTKTNMRPAIASYLNTFYYTNTYTASSPEVLRSYIQGTDFVKNDVIAFSIYSPLINYSYNIFRRSDYTCLYTGADWYSRSSYGSDYYNYYYYYGSNTVAVIYQYSNNSTSSYAFWLGQFTTIPSTQNLLPSNVIKTDVNTMKIQYDFIIDENNFITEYVPNGGK